MAPSGFQIWFQVLFIKPEAFQDLPALPEHLFFIFIIPWNTSSYPPSLPPFPANTR
jgi:hypothetical protein